MDLIMSTFSSLLVLLALTVQSVLTRVPEYTNHCNKTIVLAGASDVHGGVLHYDFSSGPFACHTSIVAPMGYVLHYKISGLAHCECDCPNRLRLITNDAYRTELTYCQDPTKSDGEFTDVSSNILELDVQISLARERFTFRADFFTSHYGRCDDTEVDCGQCVDRDLACDSRGLYCNYRDSSCFDYDYDIPSKRFDTNAIAGIVVAAILCVLLIFTCFRWHRQNYSSSKFCPCFGGAEEQGLSPRAREILTNHLATRGVESNRVGSDNVAYTEDGERIDPSLAEPPPEYSSLENIDKRWQFAFEDEEDTPPSYDDAVKNHEKYNVMGGIHHI